MDLDLRRLVTRHRHVAPMLSAVLAGTDARVIITDLDGGVILHREGSGPAGALSTAPQRFPITVDGAPVGWVEGSRAAAAVAAVLSYACAREQDKRALAQEALDRYRELNLIYDLSGQIGATLEVGAVAAVALGEVNRLPTGGSGFILLRGEGDWLRPAGGSGSPVADPIAGVGILGAVLDGDAEIVNDVRADDRASAEERAALASLIVAPLRTRGLRTGLIGAAAAEPIEFRAADLKILEAIAALTAPALDQAATHEAAMRAAAGRG
jgi:GAF domain-containing protein